MLHVPPPGLSIESFTGCLILHTTARQNMRDMLGNFRAFMYDVMKGFSVEPVTLHVFQRHHGRRALLTGH